MRIDFSTQYAGRVSSEALALAQLVADRMPNEFDLGDNVDAKIQAITDQVIAEDVERDGFTPGTREFRRQCDAIATTLASICVAPAYKLDGVRINDAGILEAAIDE